MQQKLYRYHVSFNGGRISASTLAAHLQRYFSVPEAQISREEIVEEAQSSRPTQALRGLGARSRAILELMSDGQARRLRQIEKLLGHRGIGTTLINLVKRGDLDRAARGCYVKAGEKVKSLPPSREILGPALARTYELLDQPRTAVWLREKLGVTRQAVEQTLKRLMKRGLLKRIDTLTEQGYHVYVRSSMHTAEVLASRVPDLKPHYAALLSKIPFDASVRQRDVVGMGAEAIYPKRILRRLVAQGLVEIVGTGHALVVRLTARGRSHPQYDANAEKARPLRETARLDRPRTIVLLAIHALGQAKSLDITLATGIGRGLSGRGTGMGQHVQQLQARGLIEAERPVEGHPIYRLSRAGLTYVTALRGETGFPTTEELIAARDKAREEYRMQQSLRSTGQAGLGHRKQAIIDLLTAQGPLHTPEINALLPDPYSNPGSISLALRELVEDKLIARLKSETRAALWGAVTTQ